MSRTSRGLLGPRWLDVTVLALILIVTTGRLFYWPAQTATMVVCKVSDDNGNWQLHTDTGVYDVSWSLIHNRLNPQELAQQIQPGEYRLTYYGVEARFGRITMHPNVLQATLIRAGVTSDTPLCHE